MASYKLDCLCYQMRGMNQANQQRQLVLVKQFEPPRIDGFEENPLTSKTPVTADTVQLDSSEHRTHQLNAMRYVESRTQPRRSQTPLGPPTPPKTRNTLSKSES
jgi:hypothetical protein